VRLIHRFRRFLARRFRYRITRGGMLFAAAVSLVAVSAAVSANNLLFLILAMMLAAFLVSGFISRLCLAGLQMDLLIPEHVTARSIVSAKLYVRNQKFWMPSFSIHVVGLGDPPILVAPLYFPIIPGGATLEESVEVRFAARGVYTENSFRFSTRFPFGFIEKTARVILRRDVLVYPSLEVQAGFESLLAGVQGELETHYRGLGRDFYRIRPYQAFESARHVDWRATAHTGSLQVREFARDQERSIEMFLDRRVAPGMEDWFERSIECCAFLCWRLAQRGTGIRFHSQRFEFRVPEEGDVYTILKFLALAQPEASPPSETPTDGASFQIVLSARPESLEACGWTPARVVGPADLFAGPDSGTGAGSQLDHRR
jgi:uncharacterized protein (DUF58 family)